jgi:hypothetical protein
MMAEYEGSIIGPEVLTEQACPETTHVTITGERKRVVCPSDELVSCCLSSVVCADD